MSKYDPLSRHLRNLSRDKWVANFRGIEKILGFALPHSARKHPAWWANNEVEGRHSGAWLSAGWLTEDLNLSRERIIFQKSNGRRTVPIVDTKPSARRVFDLIKAASMPCAWDKAGNEELRLDWAWRPIGQVLSDEQGRLNFPAASNQPAIYRIRIKIGSKESRYVGETENLKRRFGHYRNPGPTQQTSIRIHGIIKDALGKGAEIAISVVQEDAWLRGVGAKRSADLASKTVRCLFENAAICVEEAIEIESLNRASL